MLCRNPSKNQRVGQVESLIHMIRFTFGSLKTNPTRKNKQCCKKSQFEGTHRETSKFDIIIPLHSLNSIRKAHQVSPRPPKKIGAQWRCRRWYPPWHRNARPLGQPRALPPCGSERDASGFRWLDELEMATSIGEKKWLERI